jgi:hypothetical protein
VSLDPNQTIRSVAALFQQVFEAADACIASGRIFPAQVLLFSWIDIISSLHRPIADEETSRKHFLDWLRKFASVEQLGIKPIDVYAARCGALHTGSPFSALSRKQGASVISWTHTGGDKEAQKEIQERIRRNGDTSILVDIGAFRDRLVDAFGLYQTELKRNQTLQASFLKHGTSVFAFAGIAKTG